MSILSAWWHWYDGRLFWTIKIMTRFPRKQITPEKGQAVRANPLTNIKLQRCVFRDTVTHEHTQRIFKSITLKYFGENPGWESSSATRKDLLEDTDKHASKDDFQPDYWAIALPLALISLRYWPSTPQKLRSFWIVNIPRTNLSQLGTVICMSSNSCTNSRGPSRITPVRAARRIGRNRISIVFLLYLYCNWICIVFVL